MLLKFFKEISLLRQGMGCIFVFEYLLFFFLNIKSVVARKSLGVVDAAFNPERVIKVKFKRLNLKISAEMLPTTREIFLKDCYRFDVTRQYRVIMDLGANRGNFSVAAAKCSSLVIAVECDQEEMPKKFTDTMRLNEQENYIFENAYIDADGSSEHHVSVPQLMNKYGVDHIDFLKIDIEGAEKNLIRNDSSWLKKVSSLSMEVHPCFGVDMNEISNILKCFGFSVQIVDLGLKEISADSRVKMAYIYANKT